MKGGGKDGTQSMLQNMMQRECKEKHHCEWMLSVKGNCNVPVQCLYIQHKHQDQRHIYCCTFFTPDQCRTVTSDIKATTFIKEKQECDVCSLGSIFFSQGCRWERVGSRSRHAMFPASIQSRREKNSRWWQSFHFPIYFFPQVRPCLNTCNSRAGGEGAESSIPHPLLPLTQSPLQYSLH